LSRFLGFQDIKEAVNFAAECYKALEIKNPNVRENRDNLI
jgi:hypothetical protein